MCLGSHAAQDQVRDTAGSAAAQLRADPGMGRAHRQPAHRAAITQKLGTAPSTCSAGGLIPYWAKDIKIGFSTINAMAETVDTKPVFREAFKRRRCLVPTEEFMGDVALSGPGDGPELHDHHHNSERAVRRNPQSDGPALPNVRPVELRPAGP
jgi:hypothetical protein